MKKKTAKEAATAGDVEHRVAALKREIKQLVHLVGEDDEAVGDEAVHALCGLAELVAGRLAAAITRPRSRLHLVKLIFVSRMLGPKGSLETQKALHKTTKLEGDDRLANAAAAVLAELLDDEWVALAGAAHWASHGERGRAVLDPMSIHHQGT